MSENKSFSERFASQSTGGAGSFADAAKKSSFTSQSLESKTQKAAPSESESNNPNLQQIDPQKKMKADLIYLVKGVDDNRNAWYYVLVERLKVQLFLKALNDDIIHLENYGVILFSAYGDEPPEEITNKLKAEYGIK